MQFDDLSKMGHNSAEYIHLLIEAVKLAAADREAHYADPDFTDVPLAELLSTEYNRARRELIKDIGEKNGLFEPFIYKTIFLPRQARDKHRKNSPQKYVCLSVGSGGFCCGRSGEHDGGACASV